MKGIQKITIILLSILFLGACGRKKNTFLNRNGHAVTAKYNTLYNGGVAYDQGKEELSLTYRDNFWDILPVERIELEESNVLPGQSKDGNFNRSEEKAVKAIQKHSLDIDGKEYNPQIDEAYMLLGKSRYYDMRFIPALDAFNFILDRYPTSNSINDAKIWKAKTNIRLENEEYALKNLQNMFDTEDLEKDVLADASAMMAQAFINLDSIPEALSYMKLASDNTRDNELRGRYAFIKGQLYNKLEEKDSANMAFDEVIELNRKSPRVYMINAYIEKARNYDYNNEDHTAFLELLQDLEEDRENRPFLDKIYNQIGEYYRSTANIDTAVIYYNKSIRNFKDDRIMQSVNYQTLAEINFDRANYKAAGNYYDSTLTNLEEKSRRWRRITKKRENLDDVIKYEDIAILNDSILRLMAMSEPDRRAFFTAHTNKLRQKAIKDSIASAEGGLSISNNEFYRKSTTTGPSGGTFYFYNSVTVAYGQQEFRKIWGERRLEDNWRRSARRVKLESISDTDGGPVVSIVENQSFDPETYLDRLPKTQGAIDTLTTDRNFAYYQLGLIYKEKFKEYPLAANRLETLLTYQPEERLILPAKYNLFKIYEQMENAELASQYKNDIINNHADSRYAEILRNPNSALATDESSPEFKYKELYKEFEASNYQQVINKCDEYITIYNGNNIVPKLELLKATALGRQDGYEAYKKALNYVSLNYPNVEEGKQAQEIYSTVLPALANKDFIADEEGIKYKMVYQFDSTEREEAEELKGQLDEGITHFKYIKTSSSIDYYSPGVIFVVVHGFNTKDSGRRFGDVLSEHKDFRITKEHFEISTPNYKTIQIHKNLAEYLNIGLE